MHVPKGGGVAAFQGWKQMVGDYDHDCFCEVWVVLESYGDLIFLFFVAPTMWTQHCSCLFLCEQAYGLVCIMTISCVLSTDGRGWNFVPLSKKINTRSCQHI
jgi:hypothetical protein